jgi:hypothetical protein
VPRNITAALVQLLGIVVAIAGGFLLSVPAGMIVVGAVVLLVGLDLEGDR